MGELQDITSVDTMDWQRHLDDADELFRQRDEAIAEREVLRTKLEACRTECARLRSKLIENGVAL